MQRAILAAFQKASFPAFDTSELCQTVYGTKSIEKKHRVSVIRALRGLSEEPLLILWQWVPGFEKTDIVWYDYRRLPLDGPGRRPVRHNRKRPVAE